QRPLNLEEGFPLPLIRTNPGQGYNSIAITASANIPVAMEFSGGTGSLASGDRDGARLRTFFTLLLDKAHRGSGRQIVEMLVEDAVAMEIDLAVVRRFEEAVALFRENAGNAANRRQPRCVASARQRGN